MRGLLRDKFSRLFSLTSNKNFKVAKVIGRGSIRWFLIGEDEGILLSGKMSW